MVLAVCPGRLCLLLRCCCEQLPSVLPPMWPPYRQDKPPGGNCVLCLLRLLVLLHLLWTLRLPRTQLQTCWPLLLRVLNRLLHLRFLQRPI